MKYSQYTSTIEYANQLYISLYGEPTTHREWAEKFNKVGDINRIIWAAINKIKTK